MIAIAIGPQNTLRVSGTIASTVAVAVSTTGRVLCTAASTTALHGSRPDAISCFTWSTRITALRMIMPLRAMMPRIATKPSGALKGQQCRDDPDQPERRREEHHRHEREALQLQHEDRQDRDEHHRGHGHERLVGLGALLDGTADVDTVTERQLGLDLFQIGTDGLRHGHALLPVLDVGADRDGHVAVAAPQHRLLEHGLDARDL